MARWIDRGLLIPKHNNKIMLFIITAIIITMVVDVSLARIYDLIAKEPTSAFRLTIFVIITSICIAGNYYALTQAQSSSAGIRTIPKLHIGPIIQGARISQFVITALLIILILQTTMNLSYSTLLPISIVIASYGMAIAMFGLLAQRFFLWFTTSKDRTIVLYALASSSLAISAGFSLVYVSYILSDRPEEILPFSAGSMVSIIPNSERAFLNSGFFVSSVISFVLLWIATAVLLRNYTAKFGKVKYWTIVSMPLVFFLGQFVGVLISLFDPFAASDPVSYTIWITLIFTLSKPAGGALFGIAFYAIAKTIRQNPTLRNYLVLSAIGFILFYGADHASALLVAPFPPFGLSSISFVSLGSFLILLGIYSSVISISEDSKLRRSLRKNAINQVSLLDTIASAQIREEIHKKAAAFVKSSSEKIAKITGVNPSPSENEWKEYIDEVMTELDDLRKRRKS